MDPTMIAPIIVIVNSTAKAIRQNFRVFIKLVRPIEN